MFSITGYIKGTRVEPARQAGWDPAYFVGVAYATPGGYEGQETIVEVRLTREQVSSGFQAKFDGLRNKLAQVPVAVSTRGWKDRQGAVHTELQVYCAGEGKVVSGQGSTAAPSPVRAAG